MGTGISVYPIMDSVYQKKNVSGKNTLELYILE